MFMKEYDPQDYGELKNICAGRGSSRCIDGRNDVTLRPPNQFCDRFFMARILSSRIWQKPVPNICCRMFWFPGVTSQYLAHAGLKGFSTQKLNSGWQPAPRVGGPDSPEHTPKESLSCGIWKGRMEKQF